MLYSKDSFKMPKEYKGSVFNFLLLHKQAYWLVIL